MEEKDVLLIGPSTGWLFAQKIYDLPAHQKFLDEAGASAVELVMYLVEEERQNTLLSGQMKSSFISIHLDDYYPEGSLFQQVMIAKSVFDKHKATIGVVHPVVKKQDCYYETLTALKIPVAIENMDRNKPRGYHPRELWDLMVKYGLGFVLDSQHAFEHGTDMRHAWDLFEMGRTRLRYLHVSGQSPESIHSLVYKAENAKTIVEFLGKVLSKIRVPIILEGQYTTALEVKTEIEFLKKELGF